jgi:hypothetical protein
LPRQESIQWYAKKTGRKQFIEEMDEVYWDFMGRRDAPASISFEMNYEHREASVLTRLGVYTHLTGTTRD